MLRGPHWSYVSSPTALIVILFLVAAAILIIAIVNHHKKEPLPPTEEEQIRYAIKKRYAAGEITKEKMDELYLEIFGVNYADMEIRR